jgi:hypothetical protein
MRARFWLLVCFLVLAGRSPVMAWAPEGHQVAAAIAERELTPAARAAVASLLGGQAMMVLDSSWADEIRQQRPDTGSWHYVNIEIGSGGYDAARDCPAGNCVVAQIARDTRILSDRSASRAAKAEALRFLIHFVADLHQPLHAADRHDNGGNLETVTWHGKRTSLHQIWDSDVVAALGRDSDRIAANIEAGLTPEQKAQLRAGTVQAWTDESFHLAESEIYARLPSSGRLRLPNDYVQTQSAVARLQLARAGIRLAAILNRIFQ